MAGVKPIQLGLRVMSSANTVSEVDLLFVGLLELLLADVDHLVLGQT